MKTPLQVVAAVVFDGERVLMTRRPEGASHPLEWEFPGGKVEPNEAVEAALAREVREELGVAVVAMSVMGAARHVYPDGLAVEITFLRAELASHRFQTSDAIHSWRWIAPAAVDLSEVLAADRKFLRALALHAASPAPEE